MTRYIPIYALLLLLSGCVGVPSTVVDRGAEAMDKALIASEFVMCKGASVGSVQRRYGQSAELAAAWRTLCLPNRDGAPVPFVE